MDCVYSFSIVLVVNVDSELVLSVFQVGKGLVWSVNLFVIVHLSEILGSEFISRGSVLDNRFNPRELLKHSFKPSRIIFI